MSKDLVEHDGVLKNNWYIACLSYELKSKPIRRIIYDTPLVLYRDSGGSVVCMKDMCLHRGTALSDGVVKKDCIQCPYHGWEYNRDGVVSKIPGDGTSKTPRSLQNKPYRVSEVDGAIWVWMGQDDDVKTDHWRFPNYGHSGWHHYYMITDFEGDVSQLVENFMDVPHTVTVHKGWFRNQSLKEVPIDVDVREGKVLVTYQQESDEIGVLLRPLLNPSGSAMKHTDMFVFPNITRVDYHFGDHYQYIINSQCTPMSHNHTRVYTYLAYRLRLIGGLLKPLIRFYTRRVIEQDVTIIKSLAINDDYIEADFTERNTTCDMPHVYIKKLRHLGKTSETKPYEVNAQKKGLLYI